jgi:hypothetical protein
VRTELGEEVIERMIADGTIVARPAQEDEVAMKLLRTLSIVSRRRWPKDADPGPTVGVPPPKKKAAAAAPPPPTADDSARADAPVDAVQTQVVPEADAPRASGGDPAAGEPPA